MFAYCLAQDIDNFHDVENVLLSWPGYFQDHYVGASIGE